MDREATVDECDDRRRHEREPAVPDVGAAERKRLERTVRGAVGPVTVPDGDDLGVCLRSRGGDAYGLDGARRVAGQVCDDNPDVGHIDPTRSSYTPRSVRMPTT
jgi:hypothetical protein